MSAVREAAMLAHRSGLCVVPPTEDGTKRPLGSWKAYQLVRPTDAQLDAWYGDRVGVGLVCGRVSGGLEMLEFEGRAVKEGISGLFLELADKAGLADVIGRIRLGYQERTPSGGLHLLYRVPTPLPNTVLGRRTATPAELADKPGDPVRVLIETRGEGGYVIVAPSGGPVHPDGGTWTLESGGLDTIASITDDERDALFELARVLDAMPASVHDAPGSGPPSGDRPGDRFNAAPDVQERMLALLLGHGWTLVHRVERVAWLRRPGKDRGVSATLGHAAPGVLHVFSTSTAFEPGAHAPFGVYATLEHDGDFAAAARALRGSEPPPGAGAPRGDDTGGGAGGADDPMSIFLSPAQIYDGAPAVEWVVPGLIAHGALTNLDAKPKVGKTTFALMLIAASLDPDRRFLGHQVEFDRVIYLTEQGQESFREQLAAAGIGRDVVDRVDIVTWGSVHSFTWEAVLDRVRARVEGWPPGTRVLLVVDTFSKWSRIKDENDATAAMAAYRPLVLLTQDLRLATLVVRHARKGDNDDVTDTARGSNAASGEADIILSLGRPVGAQGQGRHTRILRGTGRLSGIPEELFIEIRDGGYVALPDGSEVQASEHRQRVRLSVAAHPGSTYEDIARDTGIVRTSVSLAIAALLHPDSAVVERSGRGVRNDPYRFRLRPDSVENPLGQDPVGEHPGGFPTEPPGPPPPASRGPFSTPFRAQEAANAEGFSTESPFLSRNPSERPGSTLRPASLDIDAPDLVLLARAAFGDEIATERTVPLHSPGEAIH